MKPYYQQDGITIYHGDCREVLPTVGKVDLVLTDPPYGIGEAAGKNKSRSAPKGFSGKKSSIVMAKDYGSEPWDNEPISDELMAQVIGSGKFACVWGSNYYAMQPSSAWLVWDKDNSGDFADAELAWTNYGPGGNRNRDH